MPPSSWPGYNTYIGARYVPLIFGEWDVTLQYEPLTIVTYQGASYTSKTFVPVGVPLTDTTYWVLTGDYNSQVSQIQMDLNQLEERVEVLEEQTEPLNPLYRFFQKLMRGDLCVLNTLGDSITAGNGLSAATTYPSRFRDMINKILYNNLTLTNMATSGYTSQDIVDHLTAGDYTANSPDALTLMIGANDRKALNLPLDTYIENLTKIIEYCNDNEIGLLMLTTPPQLSTDSDRTHTIAFNQAMKSLCAEKSICCFDVYEDFVAMGKEVWPTLTGSYLDRLHLNPTGAFLLARMLTNYFVPYTFNVGDLVLPGMACTKYTGELEVWSNNNQFVNLTQNTSLIFNYTLTNAEWAQAYLVAFCDTNGGSFNIDVDGVQTEINTYNASSSGLILPIQISAQQGANMLHTVTINYNDRTSTSAGTMLRIKGLCFTDQTITVNNIAITDTAGNSVVTTNSVLRYNYLTDNQIQFSHQMAVRRDDNPDVAGGLVINTPFINALPAVLASGYNGRYVASAVMQPGSGAVTIYNFDGADLMPPVAPTVNYTFYTSGVIQINNFKVFP